MQINELSVREHVARVITRQKGGGLQNTSLLSDLEKFGFDTLDLVEVILEVEKAYSLTIPDDLLLNSLEDFVNFICRPALRQAS